MDRIRRRLAGGPAAGIIEAAERLQRNGAWRCASRTAGGRPGGEGDVLSLLPRLGRSARRHARAARRRLRPAQPSASMRLARDGPIPVQACRGVRGCRVAMGGLHAVLSTPLRLPPPRPGKGRSRPPPGRDHPCRKGGGGRSPRWMRSDGTADLRRHPRDRRRRRGRRGSRRAMAAMHRVREGLGSRGRMNAVAGRRAGDRRYARHRRLIARLLRSEGTGKILARSRKGLGRAWPRFDVVAGDLTQRRRYPAMAGIDHIVFTAGAPSGRYLRKAWSGNRLPRRRRHAVGRPPRRLRGSFPLSQLDRDHEAIAGRTLINLLKKNTLLWRRRVEDHSRASAWITDHPRGFPPRPHAGERAVVVGQGARPLRFRLASRAPTWRKRSSRRCATGASERR